MTYVPAQYKNLINQAATDTGLPENVVAAQVSEESGFNPNAVSPAGAEGMFQFEPATAASYGGGNLFDPSQEVKDYEAYMDSLLKQENGNVYAALEAYNEGPGNLQAGSGYASTILSNAGVSTGLTVTPGQNPTPPTDVNTTATTSCPSVTMNPLTWVNIPSSAACAASGSIVSFVETDIVDWAERVGLIVLGSILMIIGFYRISGASKDKPAVEHAAETAAVAA